jgi:hypothetical protein
MRYCQQLSALIREEKARSECDCVRGRQVGGTRQIVSSAVCIRSAVKREGLNFMALSCEFLYVFFCIADHSGRAV